MAALAERWTTNMFPRRLAGVLPFLCVPHDTFSYQRHLLFCDSSLVILSKRTFLLFDGDLEVTQFLDTKHKGCWREKSNFRLRGKESHRALT
jgi:hypothetical protein